ncbi:MAG: hypothetical protein H6Q65_45 [Firmicutes bacterium]|nr:hypothetical protein [Bacillota bacterium]
MGTLEILNADCASHLELWLQLWHLQPEKEIFSHPEFVKLFCRPGDFALCAYLEISDMVVMFPFILKPLSKEKWAGERCQYYDIASPHGYGGLSYSCKNKLKYLPRKIAEIFWQAFDEWAAINRVVTCFVRFSPYSCHADAFSGNMEEVSPHVYRSLDAGLPDIWNSFAHKVRTNIRRAVRNGLRVEIDSCGKRIEEFKRIYYATMDRKSAQQKYYFSEDFFSAVVKKLNGKYLFFHTLYANKVVSTELILVSDKHMYSFLGGTEKEALRLYPNEIIKAAAIRWGIENGKKMYMLGGGYNNQCDNLFRYKKAFAPDGINLALIGKKVYDEAVYWNLYAMRSQYELKMGNAIELGNGFFPIYRNPAVQTQSNSSEVCGDDYQSRENNPIGFDYVPNY